MSIATAAPPDGAHVVCHTVDGQDLPLPPRQAAPDDTGASSGDSGASSGGIPAPVGGGVPYQVRVPHSGQDGDSGNSGAGGVAGTG